MSINSKKELGWGNWFFRRYCAPEKNYGEEKRAMSPYFARFGFSVPMHYAAYFSDVNGIVSDRYLSPDLCYFYVMPALNRDDFKIPLTDKGFYPVLFRGVRQPEIVVSRENGFYFDGDGRAVSARDAVALCVRERGRMIVKPAVGSSEGRGVQAFENPDDDECKRIFGGYDRCGGFVVQRFVRQHPAMAALNPTSLNTMRMFTYRSIDGDVKCLTGQNFVRFGSRGECKDNISNGGGFVPLDETGAPRGVVYSGLPLRTERFGEPEFRVPGYAEALDFTRELHMRLPWFDSIGWDVAIGEDGKPVMVEFNPDANLRSAQIAGGPMFGEFIDEVMERVKCVKTGKRIYSEKLFRDGFRYMIPIGDA